MVFCEKNLMRNKYKISMKSTPPIVPFLQAVSQLAFLQFGCASSSSNRCDTNGQYEVVHGIL